MRITRTFASVVARRSALAALASLTLSASCPVPTGTMTSYGTGCLLTLTASAAPCIPNGAGSGTTVDLIVSNIPASSLLNFIVYDYTPLTPGFDLTPIGAPGCFQYIANVTFYNMHVAAGSTDVFPTSAPWIFDSTIWSGVPVHFQAASLVVPSAANPLGLRTSNRLTLMAN